VTEQKIGTNLMPLADAVIDRFPDIPLRIGTRRSPMAMHQANAVKDLIGKVVPGLPVELVPMTTAADQWQGELAALGGKGHFVKEIDQALMAGRVDIAVHCLKDVPGDVPLAQGTAFGAILKRDDPSDVLVTRDGTKLADLPAGAKLGTGAVRRRAQLARHRPDLRTERLRGLVGTRLGRLDSEEFDGMVLALAGLHRINEEGRPYEILPPSVILSAVGAGVIVVQARTSDEVIMNLLSEFSDEETTREVNAERAMLHALQGHCNSPIAGRCLTMPNGRLQMRGMVFNRDGSRFVESVEESDAGKDAATLGFIVGADLLKKGARELITATQK
jgi:hydroxymethylbilane synthase